MKNKYEGQESSPKNKSPVTFILFQTQMIFFCGEQKDKFWMMQLFLFSI